MSVLTYAALTAGDYHLAMGMGIWMAFTLPILLVGCILLFFFVYDDYVPLKGTWRGRRLCLIQMVAVGLPLPVALFFVLR